MATVGRGLAPAPTSMMKKAAATAAFLAAVVALSASPPVLARQVGQESPLAAAPAAVAYDEQAFALDLLARLGPASANLVLSPSSAAELLAMVELGASGTTQVGIAEALHSAGLGPVELASGWQQLQTELQKAARAGHIDLGTANEAWLQDGLTVRAAYLRALAQYFGAGVEHANMTGNAAAAAAAINSWVAGRTRGHIVHVVSPSELLDAVVVLVDAVYLDAPWAEAFPSSLTAPAPFYISPTGKTQVEMMSSTRDATYAVSATRSLDAALLPYAGGRISALVLMPPLGQLGKFEAKLTPEFVAGVVAHLQRGPALVKLPKFSLSSSLSLRGVLEAMGMRQAFANSANFSGLSPEPLELSFVVHDAQMVVNEDGTEASAATGGGIVATAIPARSMPQVVFDHPFVVLVRDNASGAVLFEAQVGDPAA